MRLIIISLFVILLCNACERSDGNSSVSGGATPYVSFQPIFSPVSITFKSTGEVGVNGELDVVLPFGRIAAGVEYPINPTPDEIVIVVRHAASDSQAIYKISTNSDFEATYEGKGKIRTIGRKVVIEALAGTLEVKPVIVARPAPAASQAPAVVRNSDIPDDPEIGQMITIRYQLSEDSSRRKIWQDGKEVMAEPGKPINIRGRIEWDRERRQKVFVFEAWNFWCMRSEERTPLSQVTRQ